MTSSLADNPYKNIVFAGPPPNQHLATIVSKSVSLDGSDSDPGDDYLNMDFLNLPMKKRTVSQGSASTKSSECSSQRRPVAVPRKKLSQSTSFSISKSCSEKSDFRPPLPPKPNDAPAVPDRGRVQLKKYNSKDSTADPQRPVQRPRNSEIRRAQDRARIKAPVKGTPQLSVVDEDGLETASTYSVKSNKSTASNISSKSAPGGGGGSRSRGVGDKPKKKRTHYAQEDVSVRMGSKTSLQVPERPPRPRRRSEGEVSASTPAPPLPTRPPSVLASQSDEAEGLNKDVANTILRYIITSEDQTLKNALRDLIKEDSKTADILKNQ